MEYKTLLTNFQRELLFSIIFNMRKGKIDKKQAKKIAKVVLPAFKSESIEAFFKEIERISKYSPEISEAFVKTLEEYEKESLVDRLNAVRTSLNSQRNTNDGSAISSLNTSGIVHTRVEERNSADLRNSNPPVGGKNF